MRIARWQTPWPPIRISDVEWIVIRDSIRHPTAIIRRVELAPGVIRYRVVTWAEKSADRRLVGYCLTLEIADMSVRFSAVGATTPRISPPWTTALTAEDWERHGAAATRQSSD